MLRPEHAGHRGEQSRRRAARGRSGVEVIVPEALDPGDLRIELYDLPENVDYTGDQDAEDDAVYRGISHERIDELVPEHGCQPGYQHEKQSHPNEETPRPAHPGSAAAM